VQCGGTLAKVKEERANQKTAQDKEQFDDEIAQNAHQMRQRRAVKAQPIETDVDLKDQQDGDGPHQIEAEQAARCGFRRSRNLARIGQMPPPKTHVINLCILPDANARPRAI
jgi:DNA-binding helix-hairpin-helix protein with protein kinase domain